MRPGPVTEHALLERELELAILLETIESAEGRLALIEGEAGIGKTALLDAVAEAAAARGRPVLRAQGAELERDFAHGVCRQLFEGPMRAMSGEQRHRLLSGAARPAAAMLGIAPQGPSEPADPLAANHALFWLVAGLADDSPLVLAIDDAHWADEVSLRWVHYLGRRLEGLDVVVVLALRPAEPGAPADLLDALRDLDDAVRVRPGALSESASGRVLGRVLRKPVEPEFSRACREATGGNPFLLRELARALADEGTSPAAGSVGKLRELAPRSVSRRVLGRLGALMPDALALVQAVAVLDVDAELRHAAILAGLEEEAASTAADALVEAHILLSGPQVRFVHPLVRHAVYEEIGETRRSALHRRAARVLAATDADPDRAALHLLHAAQEAIRASSTSCGRRPRGPAVAGLRGPRSRGSGGRSRSRRIRAAGVRLAQPAVAGASADPARDRAEASRVETKPTAAAISKTLRAAALSSSLDQSQHRGLSPGDFDAPHADPSQSTGATMTGETMAIQRQAAERDTGSSSPSGPRDRLGRLWRDHRRFRVAMVGYFVVIVLGVAYGAAHAVAGKGSTTPSLIAAVVIAAPLVIALIGDRITGIKVLSMEISLSEVSLVLDDDMSKNMQELAEMGPSVMPEIAQRIVRSIAAPEERVLLRVNLGDGERWWSTRIFLLAALAADYTSIRSLVFVHGDQDRYFQGFAEPAHARSAMARVFSQYETAYRALRSEARVNPAGEAEEVNFILQQWPSKFSWNESAAKEFATSARLSTWLGSVLDDSRIEWQGAQLSMLVRYDILGRPGPYVALTSNGRLRAVVDRAALATSTAREALQRHLE